MASALVASALVALPATATAAEFRLLAIDGVVVKWGASRLGTGTKVSWSLQREDRHEPDAINCQDTTTLDGLSQRTGVSRETFRAQATAAFDMWQSRTDLDFVEAAPGETADIVIGAQISPQGIAWTNIDFERPGTETPPPAGPALASLTQAAICLNPEVSWSAGPDGNRETYDLRLVLAHEIGHAIGLDHPGKDGHLMGFAYQEDLDDLTAGDVAGVVRLYGARPPRQTATIDGPPPTP